MAAAVRARYGWDRPLAASPDLRHPEEPFHRDTKKVNVFVGNGSRYTRATGIFTPQARRIVAEDVLIVAELLGRRALTTGHVLLAILESDNYLNLDFTDHWPGASAWEELPSTRELTAAVIDALPGHEDT